MNLIPDDRPTPEDMSPEDMSPKDMPHDGLPDADRAGGAPTPSETWPQETTPHLRPGSDVAAARNDPPRSADTHEHVRIEEPDDHGPLLFIKDNLEAFAVAVVMALVIKHFCVEAFKIPTASMVPTLLGDNHSPDQDGDRILVTKGAYLFSDPERWDVPVFRYPLDRSRNFIKRIVGLGGEHLRIHEGDIWIRRGDAPFRIARKSPRTRNQLYFAVYPPADADRQDDAETNVDVATELDKTWRFDGPDGAWRLVNHGRFEFVGGPSASIVSRHAIHSGSTNWSWPRDYFSESSVRDVRVRATIERGPPPPADLGTDTPPQVTLTWSPDGDWEVRLIAAGGPGGSRAELRLDGRVIETRPLEFHLAPNQSVDVTLEYVDGDMRISIDGDERLVLADNRPIDADEGQGKQALTITAQGAPIVVRDLSIDRDLWYENKFAYRSDWQRDGIQIPEDAYFVLGDNTTQSSDSRKWRIRTIHLEDGRKIRFDDNTNPEWLEGDQIDMKRVVDVDGVARIWRDSEQDADRGSSAQNAPFVWRELIVGRAFLIFWPLTPEPPGRLRFIH